MREHADDRDHPEDEPSEMAIEMRPRIALKLCELLHTGGGCNGD
jgi:hypothetical protein